MVELRGRPRARVDLASLSGGHDETKAVESAGQFAAAKSQRDRRGGNVADGTQLPGEDRIELLKDVRRHIRGSCEDHIVGPDGGSIGQTNPVLIAFHGQRLNAAVESHLLRIQSGRNGVRKLLQTAGECGEHRRALARGRLACLGLLPLHHAEHQAAVGLLHVRKHREGAAQAEALRIAGVDAGHQRPGDLVQQLRPHPSAHKTAQALIGVRFVSSHEDLQPHAQLSRPGDQSRPQEGKDHRRGHQHHALGHWMQAAFAEDIGRGRRGMVGADELVAQPELAAQLQRCALLRQERIRAAFDQESVAGVGGDLAAKVAGALQQETVGVLPCEILKGIRGRETGDSTADDDYLPHHAVTLPISILTPGR